MKRATIQLPTGIHIQITISGKFEVIINAIIE